MIVNVVQYLNTRIVLTSQLINNSILNFEFQRWYIVGVGNVMFSMLMLVLIFFVKCIVLFIELCFLHSIVFFKAINIPRPLGRKAVPSEGQYEP